MRAPDFTQVSYEFTFDTAEHAQTAFDGIHKKLVDASKVSNYANWPIGRRMKARGEQISGTVVSFIGQHLTSELSSQKVADLEAEFAGANGTMTGRTLL